MKYFIYFLIFAISPDLFAQPSHSGFKKTHSFFIAYGRKADTRWWRDVFNKFQMDIPGNTDDGWLKYEYGVNNNIGIGLETGILSAEKNKSVSLFEEYRITVNALRFLPAINYYLVKNKNFLLFVSTGIGLYRMKYKAIHSYPSDRNWMGGPFPFTDYETIADNKKWGIDWAGSGGIQVFFNKNIGAYTELGLNKSVILIGIILKAH